MLLPERDRLLDRLIEMDFDLLRLPDALTERQRLMLLPERDRLFDWLIERHRLSVPLRDKDRVRDLDELLDRDAESNADIDGDCDALRDLDSDWLCEGISPTANGMKQLSLSPSLSTRPTAPGAGVTKLFGTQQCRTGSLLTVSRAW